MDDRSSFYSLCFSCLVSPSILFKEPKLSYLSVVFFIRRSGHANITRPAADPAWTRSFRLTRQSYGQNNEIISITLFGFSLRALHPISKCLFWSSAKGTHNKKSFTARKVIFEFHFGSLSHPSFDILRVSIRDQIFPISNSPLEKNRTASCG